MTPLLLRGQVIMLKQLVNRSEGQGLTNTLMRGPPQALCYGSRGALRLAVFGSSP